MGSLGIISDKLPPTALLPAAPGTGGIGIGSSAAWQWRWRRGPGPRRGLVSSGGFRWDGWLYTVAALRRPAGRISSAPIRHLTLIVTLATGSDGEGGGGRGRAVWAVVGEGGGRGTLWVADGLSKSSH